MTEAWKQWEGHVVHGDDKDFTLRQYLGGSESSAVFLTEFGGQEPQRAAIKIISAESVNLELQLSRWKLAEKFSHPHLLRIFQAGRCRLDNTSLLFVVMEYAEEDLSQILPERPLTPQEVRTMLAPTLDALAYLHAHGFAHGNLKPANIMAVNDQLKLASDKILPVGESMADLKRRTPYDSPEKASRGSSLAGDIWSLGMTVAEILTQRLPSWKENEQEDPVVPESLPAPFFEIVRNCLRRDPQRRLTIAGIAERLNPAAPTQPALPPPLKLASTETGETPVKRRSVIPAAAVVAAFAAAALGGARLLHRQPVQETVSIAKPEQKPVSSAPSPRTASQDQQLSSSSPPVTSPEQKPDVKAEQSPLPTTSDDKQSTSNTKPPSTASAPSERTETTKTTTERPEHGGVLHEVLPDVPQKARDTITGKVRIKIRVHVDSSGSVVGAELDSPGPSKYFAQLAMQAAQRWKFTPSQADGHDASRDWILRFEFGSAETKVFPAPVTP
jgi:TonB family protein